MKALLPPAALPEWNLDGYVARKIDEFGSLALRLSQDRGAPDLSNSRLLASAYFDDGDGKREGLGPFIEILLFEMEGKLTELQIFRSDGSPIQRAIEPEQIFMITR